METEKTLSKPTVTVAISALNEEGTIGALIKAILEQRTDGFDLEKILIVSDGSTDRTVEIASSFCDARIEVRSHKTRRGLLVRLNEIYLNSASDILVQFDADIVIPDALVIEKLIKAFIQDDKLMMVCGQAEPLPPQTLLGKAVNCTFEAYAPIKEKWQGGHNIFSVHGCISAFRKELLGKMRIPTGIMGNDLFTYLRCRELGYDYKYVRSAIVYFRLPQTLPDHINQNTRQHEIRQRIKKYFSEKLIEQEFGLPFRIYAANMISQVREHPWLSIYIFIVNRYCWLRSYFFGKKFTDK